MIAILVIALIASQAPLQAQSTTTNLRVCNILDYRSASAAWAPDDWAPAIAQAYTDCVVNQTGATLLVPEGTYDVNVMPITFTASNWTFQLDGTLNFLFNPNRNKGALLKFTNCSDVTLMGNGTVKGNGELWRPNGNLTTYPDRPRLIHFLLCENVRVTGITVLNSPTFHITLNSCNDSVIHDVTITADRVNTTSGTGIGTDGINLSGRNNIVRDVSVDTGGDCVTANTGTNGLLVENIFCNQTGGLVIATKSKTGAAAAIENVHFRNCTMKNSYTATLIKAQPTQNGYVRNVVYEDFNVQNTSYVMLVNEFFGCDVEPASTRPCPPATGSVKVSNITYNNFVGFQRFNSSAPVVSLICIPGSSPSCFDIKYVNINVTSATASGAGVPDIFQSACGTGRAGLPAC